MSLVTRIVIKFRKMADTLVEKRIAVTKRRKAALQTVHEGIVMGEADAKAFIRLNQERAVASINKRSDAAVKKITNRTDLRLDANEEKQADCDAVIAELNAL